MILWKCFFVVVLVFCQNARGNTMFISNIVCMVTNMCHSDLLLKNVGGDKELSSTIDLLFIIKP